MTNNVALHYTRSGVASNEQKLQDALRGDIAQAASILKQMVEQRRSSKVPTEGPLAQIYDMSRTNVIREIISRMRSLSGEDLGAAAQPWIEKYWRAE